jgi:diguanylate cyclase (GGDEF)-like protein/putative nucleotidyltransferase with HDIG domain
LTYKLPADKQLRVAHRVHIQGLSMLVYKIGLAICVVLILAATALVPESGNHAYFAYSLLALMAFSLELTDGSTMGFVFIILALPRLTVTETLLMAGSALFIHAVIRKERHEPKVLLQLLASNGLAILGSQAAYHAPNFARFDQPAHLMMAAGVCFVAQRVFITKKPDLWSFVYYPVAAAIAALFPVSIALPPLLYLTWRSYRLYERRLEQQRAHLRAAISLHLRTIETLTLAIEAKDHPLTEQPRRVQIYAVEMAKDLGLSTIEIEALRTASLLYDIGEMAVPENIILKPGPLTPEEFDKVKIHPMVGAEILERVKFPYPVAPIVAAHHERWDGTGYPHGLKGDQIPIGARILAVVDALNALTSARHYRPAVSLEEALRRVSADSGRAFDPRVVARLRKRCSRWEKLVAEQPRRGFINSIFSAQREGQAVFDLIQKLGSSLDLNETFSALNTTLRSLTRFETLVVWIEQEGALAAEYVDGAHLALCSSLRVPMGGGVSGWVAANGKSIINGDATCEMAHVGKDPEMCPFRCALAVPLADGIRGSLTLYRMTERLFTAEDARILAAVAPKLSVAVANGLKFRQTSDQAATDGLTGLPNAGALFGRLSRGVPATVLVCDLDGFKGVNDRFGHLTGNQLLQGVADGFRRSCRGDDFVARMGGDEFVLLIENISAEELGFRISQFREMVRSVGRQICGEEVVDASFGAAFYPMDGTTPDELLAVADHQMYRRKADQKAGVRMIDQRKLRA